MAQMREIKRRIDGTKNIRQITRAMHMVAAAKVRQAEEKAEAARPYAEQLRAVLARLSTGGDAFEHPLLSTREEGESLFVVVTGDRGLAGPYNLRVTEFAEKQIEAMDGAYRIIPVGRFGRDYFERRQQPFGREFLNLGEDADYPTSARIARYLMDVYDDQAVREIRVIYTEYESALAQTVEELTLLPLTALGDEAETASSDEYVEYFYEPSPEAVLNELLPKFVENQFYQVMMEAKASEHGSRMTAMKNATDNAEELIEDLQLEFNRARQTAITQEIAEIVSGSQGTRS